MEASVDGREAMEELVPIESAGGGGFGGSFFRLRGHLAVRVCGTDARFSL
jgi:hypothetical protein